jgi:5'-nucleotidase
MGARRRVLLINDDGLFSPGLTTLARELLQAGDIELRVVAPEREQSGVGHCVTLHTPLFAEPASLPGQLSEVAAYQVAGTPADCVKLAITNLFPDFGPELVISGINRGPNVGINVFYSGTVGGALEACINGLPALALSLDVPGNGMWHFALAAEWSMPLIQAVLEHSLPAWTILNVNFPDRQRKDLRGYRLTRHGRSGFREYYTEEAPEGRRRRFILDGTMVFRDTEEGFDAEALRAGWISVTPLGLSLEDAAARGYAAKLKFLSVP